MRKTNLAAELIRAKKEGYAIGAFNIFDYTSARAVVAAAEEAEKPVILQTSVGTVKYYSPEGLFTMLEGLMKNAEVPVYLHLDHCTSVDFAKVCVDAGWDSIMIDASKEPLEENIRMTREAADYAHRFQVCAEGELGIIEGVEEDIQSECGELASYEECMHFVKESHVDFFAPAIGTAHGVYRGVPKLNFELVGKLGKNLSEPTVCHGGTGLSEETFQKLISLGISKINISTALKHAYIDGAKAYAAEHPEEYLPLKMEEMMYVRLREVAKKHIEIFSNGK